MKLMRMARTIVPDRNRIGEKAVSGKLFAENIRKKYEPGDTGEFPPSSFVFLSADEEQESEQQMGILINYLVTLNQFQFSFLKNSYMRRYYLSIKNQCDWLTALLGFSGCHKEKLNELQQIYQIITSREEWKQEAGILNRYHDTEERNQINLQLYQMKGQIARKLEKTSGKQLDIRRPWLLADTEVSLTAWSSEEAKKFFWKIQRVSSWEQQMIFRAAGVSSLIGLMKKLKMIRKENWRQEAERLQSNLEVLFLDERVFHEIVKTNITQKQLSILNKTVRRTQETKFSKWIKRFAGKSVTTEEQLFQEKNSFLNLLESEEQDKKSEEDQNLDYFLQEMVEAVTYVGQNEWKELKQQLFRISLEFSEDSPISVWMKEQGGNFSEEKWNFISAFSRQWKNSSQKEKETIWKRLKNHTLLASYMSEIQNEENRIEEKDSLRGQLLSMDTEQWMRWKKFLNHYYLTEEEKIHFLDIFHQDINRTEKHVKAQVLETLWSGIMEAEQWENRSILFRKTEEAISYLNQEEWEELKKEISSELWAELMKSEGNSDETFIDGKRRFIQNIQQIFDEKGVLNESKILWQNRITEELKHSLVLQQYIDWEPDRFHRICEKFVKERTEQLTSKLLREDLSEQKILNSEQNVQEEALVHFLENHKETAKEEEKSLTSQIHHVLEESLSHLEQKSWEEFRRTARSLIEQKLEHKDRIRQLLEEETEKRIFYLSTEAWKRLEENIRDEIHSLELLEEEKKLTFQVYHILEEGLSHLGENFRGQKSASPMEILNRLDQKSWEEFQKNVSLLLMEQNTEQLADLTQIFRENRTEEEVSIQKEAVVHFLENYKETAEEEEKSLIFQVHQVLEESLSHLEKNLRDQEEGNFHTREDYVYISEQEKKQYDALKNNLQQLLRIQPADGEFVRIQSIQLNGTTYLDYLFQKQMVSKGTKQFGNAEEQYGKKTIEEAMNLLEYMRIGRMTHQEVPSDTISERGFSYASASLVMNKENKEERNRQMESETLNRNIETKVIKQVKEQVNDIQFITKNRLPDKESKEQEDQLKGLMEQVERQQKELEALRKTSSIVHGNTGVSRLSRTVMRRIENQVRSEGLRRGL